jgi:hypothetical protein
LGFEDRIMNILLLLTLWFFFTLPFVFEDIKIWVSNTFAILIASLVSLIGE